MSYTLITREEVGTLFFSFSSNTMVSDMKERSVILHGRNYMEEVQQIPD